MAYKRLASKVCFLLGLCPLPFIVTSGPSTSSLLVEKAYRFQGGPTGSCTTPPAPTRVEKEHVPIRIIDIYWIQSQHITTQDVKCAVLDQFIGMKLRSTADEKNKAEDTRTSNVDGLTLSTMSCRERETAFVIHFRGDAYFIRFSKLGKMNIVPKEAIHSTEYWD
ncbi:hypothetical protein Nepgr_000570 [Nepenthes gracilis]|uniref:Uncharacterized protein n=1 Tax=Nepenthes gracilis TaxID=150966 RepID=A0AAD3RWK7_NEPGR|nr:hypothetical protein Nepgr_000570 [Nepenthes gracilis]